jgi:hypothetical protein
MISMQLLHAHDTKQPTQTPFCSALVTFFASCSPSKTKKLVDLTLPNVFLCNMQVCNVGVGGDNVVTK